MSPELTRKGIGFYCFKESADGPATPIQPLKFIHKRWITSYPDVGTLRKKVVSAAKALHITSSQVIEKLVNDGSIKW